MDERVTGREVRESLQEWEKDFSEWAEEARLAYSMTAGDQWDDADTEALREMKRPAVTFNRIAAMIRGVCGLEVSQRQEARYLAREMGDLQSTEMQNAAAKWAREGCDAEDEESDAFRDMLTCGMGWIETRVSFDESPEGKLVIERIDPLDARWDPTSTKKSLSDTRWRARLKRMDIEDVRRIWPDKQDELEAYVEGEDSATPSVHINSPGDDYRGDDPSRKHRDEVVLVQYQYWKHVFMARVVGMNGQQTDVPEDRIAKMPEEMRPQVIARFRQREFRQAITCGPVTLEDKPLHTGDFTLHCMTGQRDRNKRTWYGLVKDMIDPQRWGNKLFSSVLDILATNAKGGVMAETTAVEDPRKFEQDWANPRSTVWLKQGGTQKITPRPGPNIPAALGQAMEFAVNNLPQISGINLEFLGTTDRNQPGILEYHRKQSVANSLAEFFAALRQYRKQQGKVLLELIYAYLADGRLIRITGKQSEQYLPLYKQADVEYDVVVDEAASAPDRKMQAWMALEQLLPLALKAGMAVPPTVLDYSPLPQPLVQDWKEELAKQPKLPPEMQQQMLQMQQQVQKLQEENTRLKAGAQQDMAKLQIEAQTAQQKAQFDTQRAMAEIEQKRQVAAAEMQLKREVAMAELELEREKAEGALAIQRLAASKPDTSAH